MALRHWALGRHGTTGEIEKRARAPGRSQQPAQGLGCVRVCCVAVCALGEAAWEAAGVPAAASNYLGAGRRGRGETSAASPPASPGSSAGTAGPLAGLAGVGGTGTYWHTLAHTDWHILAHWHTGTLARRLCALRHDPTAQNPRAPGD